MTKIKLEGVAFSYFGSRELFKDISLSIERGKIIAITGFSGCGKTTLLKICAGLLEPTEGDVKIDGTDFWELDEISRNEIRSAMGFDFQDGALITNMTVYQNLALPLKYHGAFSESETVDRVNSWMKRMSLIDYCDKFPAALSFGIKRRVSLARAAICAKDVVFIDEPARVLDDAHLSAVKELVDGSGNKMAIVVATADDKYIEQYADKIVNL